MILSSTQKVQVVLAGAITTNQLAVAASWADIADDGSTFAPGNIETASNSTTAVDVVAAPSSGFKRQLKEFSVYNADTVAATVTVRVDTSGTARIRKKVTLQAGESLEYLDAVGWRVLLATGATSSGSVTSVNGLAGAVTLGGEVIAEPVNALASSGTIAIDCALGDYFTLAATGNMTSFTFSNLPASGKAQTIMVRITQDATGSRVATWPSSFKWAGGSVGVLSTAANSVDVLAITTFNQGTSWIATLAKAFA